MKDLEKAARMALEALEFIKRWGEPEEGVTKRDKAITALRQALEQSAQQQEPVALKPCWYESKELKMCSKCGQVHAEAIIDTSPQPAQNRTEELLEIFKDVDQIGPLLGIKQPAQQEPVTYAKDLIEGLYENGDPVSVDAAELLEKLIKE